MPVRFGTANYLDVLSTEIVDRGFEQFLFVRAVEHGDIGTFRSQQKRRRRTAQTCAQDRNILILVTQFLISISKWRAQAMQKSQIKSKTARSRCFLSSRRARSDGE